MEFLKLWEILSRRRFIAVGAALVFFITVLAVTHLARPVYKAQAKILIESSKALTNILSALNLSQATSTATATTSSTGSDYTFDTPIAMTQIKPLLIELINSLNLKRRDGTTMKADKLVKWNLINTTVMPEPYIDVDQYGDADMLQISSYSTDPKEAINMSNKLAELYIKREIGRMDAEYKAARLFIEGQIEKTKDDYYRSLKELKNFQIKEETIDLSTESTNMLNKIVSLKSTYEDTESSIIGLEKKLAEGKRRIEDVRQFRKDSEEIIQSDQIKSLKTKLNEQLISVGGKSLNLTKEHPEYRQLEKEIDTMKELIKGEIERVFNSEKHSIDPVYDDLYKGIVTDDINKEIAITKKNLISRYISAYKSELLNIPVKSIQNTKLNVAITINKDIYSNLQKYQNQLGIAESVAFSEFKLIEPASIEGDDKPSFPNKLLNYVLGLLFGLFFGVVAALFIEYIDNTIKTPEDIRKLKYYPLLGVVPHTKLFKKMPLISQMDVKMPIVEAYRSVRNNIGFASTVKPIKNMVITSSIDSEGRSTTASNLAINFGMGGKKVLLVDMDLRRPSLSKLFQLPDAKGITNVIAEEIRLEEAIIKTGIKGLDILPSGPIPYDPARLVESQRIIDVLTALKERYDIVVIDTPPIMAINDAVVLGGIADGVIFVVEPGRVSFDSIEHTREVTEKAGINVIGVVLNNFRQHGRF